MIAGARSGEIAHRAEPDLKNGRGGLRDVQLLDALAIAQLTDGMAGLGPIRPVAVCARRTRDCSTSAPNCTGSPVGRGISCGRRTPTRSVPHCGSVTGSIWRARSAKSARTISYAVDVGSADRRRTPCPGEGLSRLRRSPVRRPLDEGVVEHAGEVVLARDAGPSKDPGLILRVAAASARTGLPMAAATLRRLADNAPELREPWPADALSDLSGAARVRRAHDRADRGAGPNRTVGPAVPGVGRGARSAAA